MREICLSKGWLPRTDNQWQQLLKTERGLHAETAESALIVILKLVISGLTSVILVALGAVNLQFQGQFVSTSLKATPKTVAAISPILNRQSKC